MYFEEVYMAELSITEVRRRLAKFAIEHANDSDEKQHAQQFWRDFYACFGLSKSSASMFEARVVKLGGKRGYIDSFIPSLLLVEQKSIGKDLDDAYMQAQEYFHAISNEFERPKYIVVCDFAKFRIYNLDVSAKDYQECSLEELSKKADWFKFLLDGKKVTVIAEELPINRKAAEQIAKLHEALLNAKYNGHDLEVFLTRLLFCLFADDTGIFGDDGQFRKLVESTKEDGSDTGSTLSMLFDVLNTSKNDRQSNLDDAFKAFEYVNGNLFSERIKIPFFDYELRKILVNCAVLDWSGISPAIFGAMFQGVLEDSDIDTAHRKESRRELGAHYTSERNILKLIKPLFIDGLREELEKSKGSKVKLKALYDKLSTLKFIDPACGCGNFLVIAYRELRRVEIDVISELFFKGEQGGLLDIKTLSNVSLEQFYGIEIDDAAVHIARVAMYITDHQLNLEAAQRFGEARATVPLISTPHIIKENALKVDWCEILPAFECSYVLGNPPFVGKNEQTKKQKEELIEIFKDVKGAGVIDYVACWYVLASQYLQKNKLAKCAFVSTNSITQGEQVGLIWGFLKKFGVYINFAHRTFKWNNEGKGVAGVHCVIVGFSLENEMPKKVYDYSDGFDVEPKEIIVKNINPYLVDAPFVIIEARRTPIGNAKEIVFGNMANDGGHFFFTDKEREAIIEAYPSSEKFLKKFLGADEFIYKTNRWCLWLKDTNSDEWRNIPPIYERVQMVKAVREKSTREATVKLSKFPYLFGEIRQKSGNYVLIPRHSSENREYIPIGFFDENVICGDANLMIPDAGLYEFSILFSKMNMCWVRAVCGRLESRFRYSNTIVYNNFPLPIKSSAETVKSLEFSGRKILDVHTKFSDRNYASLYDSVAMPEELVKAHIENDKAVDVAYGYKGNGDDANRLSFLLNLYEKQTSLLPTITKKSKVKK